MAIKEFATNIDILQLYDGDITSDGTTNTAIIDTADYDIGICLFMAVPTLSGTSSFTLTVQHGDNAALSDAATCTSTVWSTAAAVSSQTTDGGKCVKQAVYGNKRYVRGVITAATVTGTNHVFVGGVFGPEVLPATQS